MDQIRYDISRHITIHNSPDQTGVSMVPRRHCIEKMRSMGNPPPKTLYRLIIICLTMTNTQHYLGICRMDMPDKFFSTLYLWCHGDHFDVL